MEKILLLSLASIFTAQASEYGELYLATPVEIKSQAIQLSFQTELDNKLHDVRGLGIAYGYRFNSYLEANLSYYRYSDQKNDFNKSLGDNVNVISAIPEDRKSVGISFIPLIGQINLLSYSTAQIELGLGANYGTYTYRNTSKLLINDNKFYDINFTTNILIKKDYTLGLKLSRITRSENAKNDTNLNTLDVIFGVRF
ncbi:hypothetical protein [Bacteriovorax sp. Seq25_V]|uniref:hypothetical protein n=1 Tax=Bacteriovorax sp. Seq25_V TaxID=1201288 RepID=UPI000389E80B|nr:hypothetical protein [Bacteriovorax sp. Seq25_V]EQC47161.1 hypothetical protein M900_0850 [Bacteriovorax sp. Seq25_V]